MVNEDSSFTTWKFGCIFHGCLATFAGRTCLMFVVFLRRMMSTLQWSRPETKLSFQLTCCCSVTSLLRSVTRKCCSSRASLVSLNALPGVLHAERSTKRTTEPDTAQTERELIRLVDTASLDSRLHKSSKRVFHNIHVLSLFHAVLSLLVLHAQLFVVLGFRLRAYLLILRSPSEFWPATLQHLSPHPLF